MYERYHPGIPKLALVTLMAALLLSGCASPTGERPSIPKLTDFTGAVGDLFRSNPRSESTPTAEALYQDGIDYFERGRYARSISFFQKLRDEYPFSKEAEAAELKIAEAYYKNEEYVRAEETYNNYLTFQPTGAHAHFVKYQLGRVNLEQFTGVDRDLEKVREARRHFESVIRDHPDSEHVADSRKQLAETLMHLAERELYIGSYYVTDQRYQAARERFENVLRAYPGTPAASKARAELARLPAAAQNGAKNLPSPGAAKPAPVAGAGEAAAGPTRFVTKKGYAYEDATRRSWYSRLNPFSWGRGGQGTEEPPAPQTATREQQGAAGETPAADAPAAEKRKRGFFSFLNPFSSSEEPATTAAPTAGAPDAASAKAVVKSVDETLAATGPSPGAAPKPPVADLPPEQEETGPEPSDPAVVLGEIDTRLGGAAPPAGTPAAPAADPALFTATKTRPSEQKRTADKPRSGLLEGIDRQLQREGIDSGGELPPPPASP